MSGKNNIKSPFKKITNQSIFIFSFFIILASAFWYLNALNKRYIHELTLPIKYSNYPTNKIQVAKLPETVDVTMEAYGYRIFSYKYGFITHDIKLNIATSSLFKLNKSDSTKYYILTNFERNKLTEQFTSDVRIINIEPDSIYFKFDELSRKKVAIKLNADFEFAPQHMQINDVSIEPDSIVITGPQTVLDTVDIIETQTKSYNELNESLNENIQLAARLGFKLTQDNVRLKLDVRQFTESMVEVPIITKNVPDTLSLITFPKNCNIYYNVPIDLYESIGLEDFRVVVDYDKIQTGKENLKLEIEKIPDHILISKTNPSRVQFIIEKR